MVFFVPVLWNQYSDIVSKEVGIWGFSILREHLSFKPRGLENTILARVLFLFQERTWERPLEPFWIPLCVSIHKSITYRWHEIKTSMKNFNGFSLPIALPVCCCCCCCCCIYLRRWRQGVLCVIQSLPHPDFGCVTRFAEWFCVRPSFLFSLAPLPYLKSPLP